MAARLRLRSAGLPAGIRTGRWPAVAPTEPQRRGRFLMKTVRRLAHAEIHPYVSGFLSLFFFDLVDELPATGRDGPLGYQLTHALLYVCLLIPSHLYELLPIAVLIGCVFVMARLAQSSEYTIPCTSGLGPWLASENALEAGPGLCRPDFPDW